MKGCEVGVETSAEMRTVHRVVKEIRKTSSNTREPTVDLDVVDVGGHEY